MSAQFENDDLAAKEATKYQKMWGFERYRKNHFNVRQQARYFIKRSNLSRGVVCDFGSGPGYAAQEFAGRGFDVIAVDIAENAMSAADKTRFSFVLAPLWNLPPEVRGNYGFCTDVLEHIPTEKVDDVLRNIADRCSNGVFFDISLRKDGAGAWINDVLHLTVMPQDWWVSKLQQYWDKVEIDGYDEKQQSMTVIVWHKGKKPSFLSLITGRLRWWWYMRNRHNKLRR